MHHLEPAGGLELLRRRDDVALGEETFLGDCRHARKAISVIAGIVGKSQKHETLIALAWTDLPDQSADF